MQLLFLAIIFLSYYVNLTIFNVKDYGAKGDGKTLDTKSIQSTFTASQKSGKKGNIVLFPSPGTYLTGPFNLTSNTEMQIEKDVVILGVQNKDLYPIIAPLPSYGKSRDVGYTRYQPLVFAVNETNLKISGEGTINGQGEYWWKMHKKGELKIGRPRLVEFLWSENIEISGVRLENPGFWTLHPTYCNNVHIHDIEIHSPGDSPNTDGIDPDSSSNVLIEHVKIHCGDDHIAIKSGMDEPGLAYNWPTRNVTIRNCEFMIGDGISIGSETSGGIFDIYVHDCSVTGGSKGTYIKTGEGRGNVVENIRYENIKVELVGEGVVIDMNWGHQPPLHNKTRTTPTVRNVYYKNIHGTAGKHGVFKCLEDSPCQGIVMDDVKIVAVEKYVCEHAYGTQKDCDPKVCLSSES